jgi:hypothetical protein
LGHRGTTPGVQDVSLTTIFDDARFDNKKAFKNYKVTLEPSEIQRPPSFLRK